MGQSKDEKAIDRQDVLLSAGVVSRNPGSGWALQVFVEAHDIATRALIGRRRPCSRQYIGAARPRRAKRERRSGARLIRGRFPRPETRRLTPGPALRRR